jgi:hypothetical protein
MWYSKKNVVGTFLLVGATLSLCAAPAGAVPTVVDLTTLGSTGSINGALFEQIDLSSTGTGLIQSFLRVQANGTERGYNTDAPSPYEFDQKGGGFTHSLLLSDVPLVDKGGTLYREFLLDINESAGDITGLLSLDLLEIYLANADNLDDYPNLGTKVYDTGEDWILLNYNLNAGSGAGDMYAYIPNSLFTGGSFVYLYSEFGGANASTAGPEEWAVRVGAALPPPPPPPPVPAPAALLLGLIGGGSAISLHRRKTL